jgi:uncharacterized protein YjbI with pentapeptide repeats
MNPLRISAILVSLSLLGCPVKNGFQEDLKESLKNVPEFNRKYGAIGVELDGAAWPAMAVSGLNLKDARIHKVEFSGSEVSRSRFTNCTFEDCHFDAAAFNEVEFVNCRFAHSVLTATHFNRCRFLGGSFEKTILQSEKDGPGETGFDTVEFEDVRLAGTTLRNANFARGKFTRASFEDIDYDGASFTDCLLLEPKFSGRKFRKVYMNGCRLEKPDFGGLNPTLINFSGSEIADVHMSPASSAEDPDFGFMGVTLKNSSFDLGKLRSHFGLYGAENVAIRNFHSRGNFGLEGVNKNVRLTNISANRLDLMGGGEFEGLDVDTMEVKDAYFDNSHLKDCTFHNLTVKEFMRMDSATFENVRWEDSKMLPAVKFSAISTPYEHKKPF